MNDDGTISAKLTASVVMEVEVVFVPDCGAAWVHMRPVGECVKLGSFTVTLEELRCAVDYIESGGEGLKNTPFGDSGGVLEYDYYGNVDLILGSGGCLGVDSVAIYDIVEFASVLRSVIAACKGERIIHSSATF